MAWHNLTDLITVAATIAFAVTAVLAIGRDRDIDLIGALFLGMVTAVGGGTIRDVVMDVPVFWSVDQSFVWVAAGASVVAFYGRKLFANRHLHSLMLYLDALGAAMFAILAVDKVWYHEFGLPAAPVILGVITAVGGGLLRDMLASRPTLLMLPELYATPVLLGCIAYVLVLNFLPDYQFVATPVCILGTFALRAAAIHWNLSIPAFLRATRDG